MGLSSGQLRCEGGNLPRGLDPGVGILIMIPCSAARPSTDEYERPPGEGVLNGLIS